MIQTGRQTIIGFTLVEILVVLSIISLLSSIVLVSVNKAKTRTYDVVRAAQENQLKRALFSYYLDNGYYPGVLGTIERSDGDDVNSTWNNDDSSLYQALVPKYLRALPTDPKVVFFYTPTTPCLNDQAKICDFTITYFSESESSLSDDGSAGGGLDGGAGGGLDGGAGGGGSLVAAECFNGLDDNGDGLIDFADFGCFGPNGQETMTNNGWTLFTPSNNTKIIFISSSDGDDATGACYGTATGCVSLTGLDFSTIKSYKTLAAGINQLRNNQADWLLLKRDDVWTGQTFSGLNKSGRSSTERLVVGSYGLAINRPKVQTGASRALQIVNSDFKYVAIVGVHIENQSGQETDQIGLRFAPSNSFSVSHLLLEDLYVSGYRMGLSFEQNGGSLTKIILRRSVIAENFHPTSDSSGMYIAGADDILIEENVFDHNGWKPGISPSTPARNHNLYIQHSNTVPIIVRKNIFARGAGDAMQFRAGGDVINNLFVRNPAAFSLGNTGSLSPLTIKTGGIPGGTVRHNVVIEANDQWSSGGTTNVGWGIDAANISPSGRALIEDNIVANELSNGSNNRGYSLNGVKEVDEEVGLNNLTFRNNIAYNVNRTLQLTGNSVLADNLFANNLIYGNIFDTGESNSAGTNVIRFQNVFRVTTDPSQVNFTNNSYWSLQAGANWFNSTQNPNKSWDINEWNSYANTSNEVATATVFSEPCRNLGTYLDFLATGAGANCSGAYQSDTVKFELFMTKARQQSKFSWNNDFTACRINNYLRIGFDRLTVDC